MKRSRQSLEEILKCLTAVETDWRDSHAEAVIQHLSRIPLKNSFHRDDLALLLDSSISDTTADATDFFHVGLTAARLFLDMSKDEFTAKLKNLLGPRIGFLRFKHSPDTYYQALEDLGILARMASTVTTPVDWRDLLTERLKGGRGSAIKGQRRGRLLEDFVEKLVTAVFGIGKYHTRRRFIGARGESDEKADFAIPSRYDPAILMGCLTPARAGVSIGGSGTGGPGRVCGSGRGPGAGCGGRGGAA
jgi:hypothetical protein